MCIDCLFTLSTLYTDSKSPRVRSVPTWIICRETRNGMRTGGEEIRLAGAGFHSGNGSGLEVPPVTAESRPPNRSLPSALPLLFSADPELPGEDDVASPLTAATMPP